MILVSFDSKYKAMEFLSILIHYVANVLTDSSLKHFHIQFLK
jgi:hypothetical protein